MLGKLSAKVLDSDRDESVTRVEFDNFLNFLRRLLAVIDNNQDCAGFNSYKTLHIFVVFVRCRGPRDFPRAGILHPEAREIARGVQNSCPREVSRSEMDVFPNASQL